MLAALCLVALVALRALRGTGGATRAMRVRERLSLDGRRAVYLVEIGDKCLVVGAGEGGLSTLAEVDPATLPREATARSVWSEAVRKVMR
jgi:flagellar biogenesis protein FliO